MLDSWFFNEADMREASVEPPTGGGKPSARWFKDAAALLERSPVRDRVIAMTQHMAKWLGWADDPDAAVDWGQLAAKTERDFRGCPVVHVMLRRTVEALDYEAAPELRPLLREGRMLQTLEDEGWIFGDPHRRQILRSELFSETTTPRGRDLAVLDFAEALQPWLEFALADVVDDRRPRLSEAPSIAGVLAECAVDVAIGSASGEGPSLRVAASSGVKALRQRCDLSSDEARRIVDAALKRAAEFTESICCECPVGCLWAPTADASAPFFEPGHPADSEGPELRPPPTRRTKRGKAAKKKRQK